MKDDSKAIRNQYQDLGVEKYYLEHGASYSNPHFHFIEKLVRQNESRLDYSSVLDFCCGAGEVSQVLEQLGYSNHVGSDPFTQKAYEEALGKTCLDYSFEDVIKGKLVGDFSTIISSFALHLCPEKQLYPLAHQLLAHTSQLVIITPHKRPVLEAIEGIALSFEDFVFTPRGKKVRMKGYVLG